MSRLYKYTGSISGLSLEKGKATSIILYDSNDDNKAPIRLDVFGGLANYIATIEGTDAEERYITSEWYFDYNLCLHRIEVPSDNQFIPAKIITQDKPWSEEVVIFGPQNYIEVSSPNQMSRDDISAWYEYRNDH